MAATKGLGKLNDYVTERFDGTDPGEFNSFMQQFDLGVETLEIHTTKQHLLLLNCLAGRPRDLAVKKLSEFKEAHPLLTTGNAAQKLALSVQLLRELKELLKSSPLVVGARPSEKAFELWGKLTQGANEKVRNYHHRFCKLEERLRTSEPPLTFPEMARYSTFVGQTEATGLRPEIQRHVKLQSGDTVEQALAAAQRFEDAPGSFGAVLGAEHAVRWVQVDNIDDKENPQPRQMVAPGAQAAPPPQASLPPYFAQGRAPENVTRGMRPRNRNWKGRGANNLSVNNTNLQERPTWQGRPTNQNSRGATNQRSHYQPRGDVKTDQKLQQRGSNPEICLAFLQKQKCMWGDDCRRLHVVSLEATRDVRPGVKGRPTQAAKDKVQELIKARESKVAHQQAREQIMHIRTTTSRAAARKFRNQPTYSEQIIKEQQNLECGSSSSCNHQEQHSYAGMAPSESDSDGATRGGSDSEASIDIINLVSQGLEAEFDLLMANVDGEEGSDYHYDSEEDSDNEQREYICQVSREQQHEDTDITDSDEDTGDSDTTMRQKQVRDVSTQKMSRAGLGNSRKPTNVERATSKAFSSNTEGDGPKQQSDTPKETLGELIERQRVLLVTLQSTETSFERIVELRNTLAHLPVGYLREILIVLHTDINIIEIRKSDATFMAMNMTLSQIASILSKVTPTTLVRIQHSAESALHETRRRLKSEYIKQHAQYLRQCQSKETLNATSTNKGPARPWQQRVMTTRKREMSKTERAQGKSHRSNSEGDGPNTDWNTYGPSTDEIRSPHPDEPWQGG